MLVFLYSEDRLGEYTPWPSAALNRRFPDFSGRGEAYLDELKENCVPWLVREWGADADELSLMGYSLGGLISIYALTRQTCWKRAVSLCGSFWYEGWLNYLGNHHPLTNAEILLHYGKREGFGKQSRMESATLCARSTAQLLTEACQVTLTYDNGGHHDYIRQRYEAGLMWLLASIQS